jgi:signal transduction histidine kinase
MARTWQRSWQWCRSHPDAAVAVVLTASSVIVLLAIGGLDRWSFVPASLSMIGVSAVVAWRRRYPVLVAVIAGVLVVVPAHCPDGAAIYNSAVPVLAAVFLIGYALGADCSWRRSLPGVAVLTAGLLLSGGPFNPFLVMITVGPWLAGMVVASRRRSVDQLELRTRELEEERGLFATESVRYERARIARELHDIVAHCVSLIVVQANAGEHLTHQDPDRAAAAFESISEAARQADTEIKRLVELLDTSTPATAPTGLRIVEELVRRARASGLHITAAFSGDTDGLSAPAGEAAYRLVQEAVTNAMKHAPGAPIRIFVRGQDTSIEVEVLNRSAIGAVSGLEGTGGGHGLAGMRERVTRCGGAFEAGPTRDQGWRVVAWLPRQVRQSVG